MGKSGVLAMDRPLLIGRWILLWGVACLAPAMARATEVPKATPHCDWRSGPLNDVVTFGLYLYRIAPLDSIWTVSFPALSQDREQNYRCLQLLFDRGPLIIPGLEAEYARQAAALKRTAPPLPKTGAEVAPPLVFLEPVHGREYLIRRIADPGWTTNDVSIIAESVWPRRSDAVRRVLRSRLAKPPKPGDNAFRALSALVRFSRRADRKFVLSRLDWVEPSFARRLQLSLLSKDGDLDTVSQALKSKVPAESQAGADALLQWGHIDAVCRRLRAESDPKRANAIADRYTSYKRGDYFSSLPDDVIAVIRKAPQAWECLPAGIKPSPFNAPRDTTKDQASEWSRPPLGGDPR